MRGPPGHSPVLARVTSFPVPALSLPLTQRVRFSLYVCVDCSPLVNQLETFSPGQSD